MAPKTTKNDAEVDGETTANGQEENRGSEKIAKLRARALLLRARAKQAFFDQRTKSDAIFKDRLNQNRALHVFAKQNLDFSPPSVKNHHKQPAAIPKHMKTFESIVIIEDHGQGDRVPGPGVTHGSVNKLVHPRQHLHNSRRIALSDSATNLTKETGLSSTPMPYSQTPETTDITLEVLTSETTEVLKVTAYPDKSDLVPTGALAQPKEVLLGEPINSHKPGFQTNNGSMNDQSKQFNTSMNFIPLSLTTPTNRVTTQQAPSLRELLTILNVPANIDPNFSSEIILKNSKIREILTIAFHNISQLLSSKNSNTTPSVKLNISSNAHGKTSGASTGIPLQMATESGWSTSTRVPVIASTTVHPLIARHLQDKINNQQEGQLPDLTNDMTKVRRVPTPVPGEPAGGSNINNTDNRNIRTDFPWEIHDGILGKVAVTPKNVQITDILSSDGDSLIGNVAVTPKNVQIIDILSRDGDSSRVNSITNAKSRSSSPPVVPERTTLSSAVSITDSIITPLPQVLTTAQKLRRNTISIDILPMLLEICF